MRIRIPGKGSNAHANLEDFGPPDEGKPGGKKRRERKERQPRTNGTGMAKTKEFLRRSALNMDDIATLGSVVFIFLAIINLGLSSAFFKPLLPGIVPGIILGLVMTGLFGNLYEVYAPGEFKVRSSWQIVKSFLHMLAMVAIPVAVWHYEWGWFPGVCVTFAVLLIIPSVFESRERQGAREKDRQAIRIEMSPDLAAAARDRQQAAELMQMAQQILNDAREQSARTQGDAHALQQALQAHEQLVARMAGPKIEDAKRALAASAQDQMARERQRIQQMEAAKAQQAIEAAEAEAAAARGERFMPPPTAPGAPAVVTTDGREIPDPYGQGD